MADPHAILLVPTEAGAALLADGVCGGRPPIVSRWPDGVSIAGLRLDTWAIKPARSVVGLEETSAVVLWWAGELVPEGWDRARRVWHETGETEILLKWDWDDEDVDRDELLDAANNFWPLAEQVLVLARALAFDGLCRVVLLDLVDGALVERAP